MNLRMTDSGEKSLAHSLNFESCGYCLFPIPLHSRLPPSPGPQLFPESPTLPPIREGFLNSRIYREFGIWRTRLGWDSVSRGLAVQ
eukprot:3623737-Pleurochrysis_carterae.AAC.3